MIPIFAKLAQSGMRWWYAVLVMAAAVAIQVAVAMLNLGQMSQLVTQFLTVIAVTLTPLIASQPLRRTQLGLDHGISLGAVGMAILGVALIYGVTSVFQMFTPAVEESSEKVLEAMGFGQNPLRDCTIIAMICIGAPLAEEALVRGGVFRSLLDGLRRIGQSRNWGWRFANVALVIATCISAFVFADMHGGEGHDGVIHILFIHGVIYALLYAASGNLMVPILTHSLNNSFAMAEEVIPTGVYGISDLPFVLMLLSPAIVIALAMLWRALIPRA